MSARETLEGSPLFPLPIAPVPVRQTSDDDLATRAHGHCAWWCGIAQDFVLPNDSGNTIEEHADDPFCMGQVGTSHEALGPQAQTTYINVELIAPYTHGTYRAEQLRDSAGSMVVMALSSPNDHCDEGMVFMEPERARSVAAALLRAADLMEGLTPKKLH